jgi:hypothetical protein
MPGTINLGSIPAALKPGVNKFYGMSYNDYPAQYTKIYKSINTDENFIKHVQTHGFGLAMKKYEGTDVSYDSLAQGFVRYFEPEIYALGFRVTHEHVRDNKYIEIANQRAAALAMSMQQTKEQLAAEPLNFSTDSAVTMADGLPLLSTAHLKSKGGTYSNRLAVDADLSLEALEQADVEMGDITNDAGLKINLMPVRLIVPRELKYEAMRILRTERDPYSADHAINAIKAEGMLSETVVHQYLTDPDQWFIQTNCPDGLQHFQREGSQIYIDTDFDSRDVKTIAMESYVFGVTDPRCVFGSPGA